MDTFYKISFNKFSSFRGPATCLYSSHGACKEFQIYEFMNAHELCFHRITRWKYLPQITRATQIARSPVARSPVARSPVARSPVGHLIIYSLLIGQTTIETTNNGKLSHWVEQKFPWHRSHKNNTECRATKQNDCNNSLFEKHR